MQFLSSQYLWTAPIAAIPLLLYLLFRRKRRNVTWGSMYILRLVMEAKSRFMAWLQYLIVALRTLAMIAVVAAFAGPSRPWRPPAEGRFPLAPRPAHRLILLDTSESMQAAHVAGTRIDAAISLSREIVRSMQQPGRADLLPLDGSDAAWTFTSFPVDEERLEEGLAECAAPAAGPADVEAGLRRAAEVFRASPFERRELYILSDFAAKDMRGARFEAVFRVLHDLGAAVHCVRYARPGAANFAVLDVAARGDVLLAQQQTLLAVRLGYYGVGSENATAEETASTRAGRPRPAQ